MGFYTTKVTKATKDLKNIPFLVMGFYTTKVTKATKDLKNKPFDSTLQ